MPAKDMGLTGQRIATLAVRNPVTVSMIFVCIVVMGAIAVTRIPLMLMPQLDAPIMFVSARYPNATPSQILESITKPIEEALATVPGVRRMSSRSSPDEMFIHIWCGMSADISMIRSDIHEKIERIRGDLPEDLRQVRILNFSTDDIPILEGTLTANRDLRVNYDFLDSRVKKPLERIPGVGEVNVWGTDRKQVDIYLRLDDLKRYRVDVGRLYRAIESANADLSLGRISDGGLRYSAVAKGALQSVEEIEQFPVGQGSLVLSDVADVVIDQRPRNQGRHQNGAQAVGIVVQKTSEANTVETVDQILDAFGRWADDPSMDGLEVRWWHNSGEEIRDSLVELLKAGSIGAILAVAVLFAFLRRIDASLAVGLAIPFSVLTATGFLYFTGGSLNTLSMMGLMLAAGMLVDNAVVVLEAIFQKRERGASPAEAARNGAGEVTIAVIAATSTTMIIFVPLLFDSESQISIMLGHFGVAVIFALLCSLFISLTLIPLAAARLLKDGGREPPRLNIGVFRRLSALSRKAAGRPRGGQGPADRKRLMNRYLGLVRWHLDRRYVVGLLVVPAILVLASQALIHLVPNNAPDARAVSSIRISYEFSENYHYAKIERDYVNPVEDFLHANMDRFKIKSTASQYGNNRAWTRAYLDASSVGSDEIAGIRRGLSEGLPVIPGARIELGQEGDGNRDWISANIYGPEPEELASLVRQARERLLSKDAIAEVFTGVSATGDEVQVRLRRDLARKYNVSPQTVSRVLGITVRSQRMRSYRTSEGEVEVWVGIDPSDLRSVEDLKSIVVGSGQGGEEVLLGHVADLSISKVPGVIARDSRKTYSTLDVLYRGDRTEDGRAIVRTVLDGLPYEPGYSWEFGFWTNQMDEDVREFVFSLVLALVMVYLVMAALFESILHPFAIMLSMPFSVVGIVLLLLATGTPFNPMAQVGLIILVGIVVNNGIVLINHVNNRRRHGLPRREALLVGCEDRFRPICMTAATTVVGLIPLAWGGAELLGMSYAPLARTVIGGLAASTVLTLILLPTYYVILDDFGRWCRSVWIASDPSPAVNPAPGD